MNHLTIIDNLYIMHFLWKPCQPTLIAFFIILQTMQLTIYNGLRFDCFVRVTQAILAALMECLVLLKCIDLLSVDMTYLLGVRWAQACL